MHKVTLAFYELDAQGDGLLCQGDLLSACKSYSDHPQATYRNMVSVLLPGGVKPRETRTVDLERFAECMAEEVIDGPALRHAFESLDNDGSQCISPEELHESLHELDETLTLEEVVAHIAATEQHLGEDEQKGSEDGGGGDGTIDFDEFVRLFPTRVARVKALEDRIHDTQVVGNQLKTRFVGFKSKIRKWVKSLEEEKDEIEKSMDNFMQKKGDDEVNNLKQKFKVVSTMLGHPPGPATAEDHSNNFKTFLRNRKKNSGKKSKFECFGFDSFVQDQGITGFWSILIDDEKRKFKASVLQESNNETHIDHFACHDAAERAASKICDVIEWTKTQLEEYESFAEVLTDMEIHLPQLPYSSRGLMHNMEEAADDKEQNVNTGHRQSCFANILNLNGTLGGS
jgi:Ca2+-binding EF-hand superfamily protein